jgi:hypothetical protein
MITAPAHAAPGTSRIPHLLLALLNEPRVGGNLLTDEGLSEDLLAQGERLGPAQTHLHQGGGRGDQIVLAAGHGGDSGRADGRKAGGWIAARLSHVVGRAATQAVGTPQQGLKLGPLARLHLRQTEKDPGLGQGQQLGLADAEGAVLVEQHRFHIAEACAAQQQPGHGEISRG